MLVGHDDVQPAGGETFRVEYHFRLTRERFHHRLVVEGVDLGVEREAKKVRISQRRPGAVDMHEVAVRPEAEAGRAEIIDRCIDDIAEAKGREADKSKGGADHNKLANVETPSRAGKAAFRHWIDTKGERSELAMARTVIDGI